MEKENWKSIQNRYVECRLFLNTIQYTQEYFKSYPFPINLISDLEKIEHDVSLMKKDPMLRLKYK